MHGKPATAFPKSDQTAQKPWTTPTSRSRRVAHRPSACYSLRRLSIPRADRGRTTESARLPKFPLATGRELPLSNRVRTSERGSNNPLALGGRHRPQRCHQTAPKAGEVVVYVQATFRGWLKAIAVVLVRLISSPSTRKDSLTQPS